MAYAGAYGRGLSGYTGLGAAFDPTIRQIILNGGGSKYPVRTPTSPLIVPPSQPGFLWIGNTVQEQAVDPSGRIIAQRDWDCWVNPDSGQFLRTLQRTWLRAISDIAVAPSNWQQAFGYCASEDAAVKAPGMPGWGNTLLAQPVYWYLGDAGWTLCDTAKNRLGQGNVVIVPAPQAARCDTLALIGSLDAGSSPLVRQLATVEEPVPAIWEQAFMADLTAKLATPVAPPPAAIAPTFAKLTPTFYTGGQFTDAAGNVITATQAVKNLQAGQLVAPTISPTVAKAVQGTPVAIVDAWGGGPGTFQVGPNVGAPNLILQTPRLPNEPVPGQDQGPIALPPSLTPDLSPDGGAGTPLNVGGSSASGAGKPFPWLLVGLAALLFLGKKRRKAAP